jgi:hypothetical protein
MSKLSEIGLGSRGLSRDTDYQFRVQTRHIAALIERHLPKIQTPNFWKVLVLCCESVPERNFVVIGGVMDVYLQCDLASYFKLDVRQKKEFAFKALCCGLEMVSLQTGIGADEFRQAIKHSESLVNEWAWPKSPSSSPDRKWKAQLWCSHEIDRFTDHLIVTDKQKHKVARAFVFEAPPSEFQFVPLMSAPDWISCDEIEVGDQHWKWDENKLRLTKK